MRSLGTVLAFALACPAFSCNGTTGDHLVSFSAYAAGAPGAGDPFTAGNYTIQLTAARMHIGAVYFDEAPPGGSGFDGPVCIASGVFAAQVPGPVDVDLLSPTPQQFAVYGTGTADTALSWQVWLYDGDVDEADFDPVVQVEGTATDAGGTVTAFGAIVTINPGNRSKGSPDPTQPGLDPLCKARIVQVPTDTTFFDGGVLTVTVDPRVWFTQQEEPFDFAPGQLPSIADPNCNPDPDVFTNPSSYALAPDVPAPSDQTCGGSSQPCCAGDVCLGALTCAEGVCGPSVCIPNSSFLPGTVPGSTAGLDLYSEVVSAAAFTVTYGPQSP
ncbi:MAG TPA: hypothetical protein VGG39_35750 [Polyangiaceae bacterium]|jgi:hypothetical protein